MNDRHDIVAAGRAFLRAIRSASQVEFDAAYQMLANQTNDSVWAHTHEPCNGLVVAMQAETAQVAAVEAACKVDGVHPRKEYTITIGETTYLIAVFSRAEVEQEYGPLDDMPSLDLTSEVIAGLVGWREFFKGPGRAFGREPTMRVGKRNVVIRQTRGLDI